jgi:hypothetical protein
MVRRLREIDRVVVEPWLPFVNQPGISRHIPDRCNHEHASRTVDRLRLTQHVNHTRGSR